MSYDAEIGDLQHELGEALAELAEERRRRIELENAIRAHRDQTTGHSMCWENDRQLWAILGDEDLVDHTPPPWPEFMHRCALYRAGRGG